ncbi:MAG TPA: hypothetical protein VN519_14890 [Bryobacteraceae bacterium]|nr:hypothetical protein [Bryobacteraceae bacterium]
MVKKLALIFVLAAVSVWADGLSLTIGPPIAAQLAMPTKKFLGIFAVRINGCADVSKAQLKAMGEGIVDSERRSAPTEPAATTTPGTYMVTQQWGNDGKWVVAVAATCGNETAGAIVPARRTNMVRGGIQLLPHAPTKAEIDAALKAFNPAQ